MLLPQLQPPPPLSSPFLPDHCVHLLLPVKRMRRVTNPQGLPVSVGFFQQYPGPHSTGFRGLLIWEGIWAVPRVEGSRAYRMGTDHHLSSYELVGHAQNEVGPEDMQQL